MEGTRIVILLCLLAKVSYNFAALSNFEETIKQETSFLRRFMTVRLESPDENGIDYIGRRNNVSIVDFSWGNCGSSNDPILIKELAVSPDPIRAPGTLTFKLHLIIARDIKQISEVEVSLKKKVLFVWVKVPCEHGVGSCTYKDVCDILAKVKCPPEVEKQHFNCRCPLLKNEFNIPTTSVKIPSLHLPGIIENGKFKVQVDLRDGGDRLGCYTMEFSLKKD